MRCDLDVLNGNFFARKKPHFDFKILFIIIERFGFLIYNEIGKSCGACRKRIKGPLHIVFFSAAVHTRYLPRSCQHLHYGCIDFGLSCILTCRVPSVLILLFSTLFFEAPFCALLYLGGLKLQTFYI